MQPDKIFYNLKLKFSQATQDPALGAVIIPSDKLLEVAQCLKGGEFNFDNLHCVTAVDRIEKIELVYIFFSTCSRNRLILKVFLPQDKLRVESLALLWKSANWFEREIYDLFGVIFVNHPHLVRILNPESWKDFPLRKNFARQDFVKKERP